MNDKRNPTLARGTGEELDTYCGRLDEYVQRLVWQSEGHRMWYTHKNPYGCWICDVIFIIEQLRSAIVHQTVHTTQQNVNDSEHLNNTKSDEL